MDNLESRFSALLGRQPSDKERQNLYRVKDALSLKNDDPIWLIFMALEHYENLYARIPKLIKEDAISVLKQHRVATTVISQKSAEEAAQLVKDRVGTEAAIAIEKAGAQIFHIQTRNEKLKWLCATVLFTVAAFAGFGLVMHKTGQEAGHARGLGEAYAIAKNEIAASSWANTPEGQLAFDFAKLGELQRLAKCTGKGWEIQNGFCFPTAAADKQIYGWKVP